MFGVWLCGIHSCKNSNIHVITLAFVQLSGFCCSFQIMKKISTWTDKILWHGTMALQFYGKRPRKRLAEGVGTDRNLPRPKIVPIAASFHADAAAKASEKADKAAENASVAKASADKAAEEADKAADKAAVAKAAAQKAACASADAKAAYKYAKKLKKHPRKLVKAMRRAHFQAKRKWLLGPAVEEAEQQTRKEEAAGAPVDLSSFRDVSLFGPPPLGPWGGPGGAGPMALPPSQSHDP